MLTTLPNRVSALLADPIQTVFRELDREFPWNDENAGLRIRKFAPLAMWEDETAFYIDVDVPGIPLADLDICVEKGRLLIRGERKAAERPGVTHDERFFGQFERVIALNEWVDPGSIEAVLSNGVLHLKLSKIARVPPSKDCHSISGWFGRQADRKHVTLGFSKPGFTSL